MLWVRSVRFGRVGRVVLGDGDCLFVYDTGTMVVVATTLVLVLVLVCLNISLRPNTPSSAPVRPPNAINWCACGGVAGWQFVAVEDATARILYR